jgi:hypothetical protein
LGFLEGVQFHAGIEGRHGQGQAIKADLKPFAVEDLGDQAAIGQGGRIAKTIGRLGALGQLAFKGLQPISHPVAIPCVFLVFVQTQVNAQVLENPKVVDRVNFASN